MMIIMEMVMVMTMMMVTTMDDEYPWMRRKYFRFGRHHEKRTGSKTANTPPTAKPARKPQQHARRALDLIRIASKRVSGPLNEPAATAWQRLCAFLEQMGAVSIVPLVTPLICIPSPEQRTQHRR